MATIVDETGREVDVVPVEAVATVASANNFSSEFPKGSAEFIERCMVAAIAKAQEEGITDPEEIRARSLEARQLAKQAISTRVQEYNSQLLAGDQEK